METKYDYKFPEKNPYYALEVTEPQFKIQSRADWFKELWVDFSKVRSPKLFKELAINLNLGKEDFKLHNLANTYRKIIYSGHKGNGKSVELKRFANKINNKDAYFVIFIDLEEETNIQQLQPEDLYVVLISLLVRRLEEEEIYFVKESIGEIADAWMSETSLVKELGKIKKFESGAEVKAGVNFWNIFSGKGYLRGNFSRNNTVTKTVRQIIKSNTKDIIEKFNAVLVDIRKEIKDAQKGKDIIFIIDGFEKASRKVYEEMFVKDVQMITDLEAHLITTVPIDTYYEIIEQGNRFDFKDFYLPMIRVNEDSIPLLKDMIYRRIDKSLIDEKALNKFVEMSGGCPRILLKMVNRGLQEALGEKITPEIADNVILKEGNERYRTLTNEHKKIIKSRQFDVADKPVLQLLQSLNILEYNGGETERKLNPVLERYFTKKDA